MLSPSVSSCTFVIKSSLLEYRDLFSLYIFFIDVCQEWNFLTINQSMISNDSGEAEREWIEQLWNKRCFNGLHVLCIGRARVVLMILVFTCLETSQSVSECACVDLHASLCKCLSLQVFACVQACVHVFVYVHELCTCGRTCVYW